MLSFAALWIYSRLDYEFPAEGVKSKVILKFLTTLVSFSINCTVVFRPELTVSILRTGTSTRVIVLNFLAAVAKMEVFRKCTIEVR